MTDFLKSMTDDYLAILVLGLIGLVLAVGVIILAVKSPDSVGVVLGALGAIGTGIAGLAKGNGSTK